MAKGDIIIETPEEIYGGGAFKKGHILGAKLIEFEILKGKEAYCANEEIHMEFSNGKEMRIYINEKGNLSIYTD